jgi:hypothetical protein
MDRGGDLFSGRRRREMSTWQIQDFAANYELKTQKFSEARRI